MSRSDWIAFASAGLAALAFVASTTHEVFRRKQERLLRQSDLEYDVSNAAKSRVLELLVSSDIGIRSVAALQTDEGAKSRVPLLRRTALQLWVVGEDDLARDLSRVCESAFARDGDGVLEEAQRTFFRSTRRRFAPHAAVTDLPEFEVSSPGLGAGQVQVWVADSPMLALANFHQWVTWSHLKGLTCYQAWSIYLRSRPEASEHFLPDDALYIYRMQTRQQLDRQSDIATQDVRDGEVWILLPDDKESWTKLVESQAFPRRIRGIPESKAHLTWQEIQEHLRDSALSD